MNFSHFNKDHFSTSTLGASEPIAYELPVAGLHEMIGKSAGTAQFVIELGNQTLQFDLSDSKLFGPGHKVAINGQVQNTVAAPVDYHVFIGTIGGQAKNKAIVFVSNNYFRANYSLAGEKWELRSVSSKSKAATNIVVLTKQLNQEPEMANSGSCRSESPSEKSSECVATGCEVNPIVELDGIDRYLEIATEADFEFYNMWGQDETAAFADISLKIAAAGEIYAHYFNISFVISFSNIWTQGNDPYSGAEDEERWLEMQAYWDENFDCVHRDIVHLFTSFNLACGYVRWSGFKQICDADPVYGLDLRHTYSMSEHPSPAFFSRYKTVAHEIGHQFGVSHTESSAGCAGLCETPSTAPLMCQGFCGGQLHDYFEEAMQCGIWNFAITLDCLGPPEPQPYCLDDCFISAYLTYDNDKPIAGCGGNDLITYTVTVCNACGTDPQDLTFRTSFQPTQVDYRADLPTDFPLVIPGQFYNFLERTATFAPEECREFKYTVQVKPNANPNVTIQTRLYLEGRELSNYQIHLTKFTVINGTNPNNPASVANLLQIPVMDPVVCDGIPVAPAFRTFEINGRLNVDVQEYCFDGYLFKMNPGSSIVVTSGNTLNVLNSTRFFGCQNLWQGITAEANSFLTIDNSTIEDAAYAVHLKGGQNISITNNTFKNNLFGLYVDDGNPTQSKKIILDAFWGNSFVSDGNILPPASGMSPGPALSFGNKPFAGVWIGSRFGSVLHSLDNSFTGISNGIYTNYTSLKVTANSFTDILENGYNADLSGFGIRSETGREPRASGATTFQQSGFGKQPGSQYSFHNCSKAIKTQGVTVDYIKENAIRAAKGIEVVSPPQKAFVENNLVQVSGSIGIQMTQPSPSTQVKIVLNDVEVGPTATNGTAIQLNMMGLDPQGNGNVLVTDNEVLLFAPNARGLHLTATNSATIKQNQVTVENGATNSSAILLNSDFNSLLNCNIATSALTTGALDATGFDISDAEGSSYTCNTAGGLSTGVYFKMGSFSPDAFQETSFEGGGVGLKVGSTAAIGPQTHKGNMWSGAFGGFGAQHESSDPQFWEQSRFTVHTNSGGFYPSLPIGQNLWFPQLPGTPADDCSLVACAQAGPTPPGNEEKFGFDDGIADYSFSNSDYPTEIGWLAKRYLYRKLTRNNALITRGSDYETFYDAESATSVGRLLNINFATADLYNLDTSTVSQLNGGLSVIVSSMETIGAIDSQLMDQGHDTVLVYQRLQEMLGIENTEMEMDSIMSLVWDQREVDAVEIAVQNANIPDTLILETNKKTVNDIYLSTVAVGVMAFDSLQTTALQSVANQCPMTGGSAVYEARSLLSLVMNVVYDDDTLCIGAQAKKGNKELVSTKNGFHLYPNPAKDQVTILIPKKFKGGEIVITNHLGSIVHRKIIGKETPVVVLTTGSLATGTYQLAVIEDGLNVFVEKLVVVHH